MFSCWLCQSSAVSWYDNRTTGQRPGDDPMQLDRSSVDTEMSQVRLAADQFRRRTSSAELFNVIGRCGSWNGQSQRQRRTSDDVISSCQRGA